ncbi:unnamed protein product [Ambrosiozyma monospora]|uniref:Unnamed protein product n=1 Tax=Ambrosiozyma monospora TaxID=43982 RepID=A0ACB5TK81_AMBMO|nr:unnamed protein product [Ambrosiozyma monospora]
MNSFTTKEVQLTDATDIATCSLLIPNKSQLSLNRIIKMLFPEDHFTQLAITVTKRQKVSSSSTAPTTSSSATPASAKATTSTSSSIIIIIFFIYSHNERYSHQRALECVC